MLRFWSDFQAGTKDAYSILRLDGRLLNDELAAELGLTPGDRVILFNDEEPDDSFQVECVLLKGDAWSWHAAPEQSTFVRYAGEPPSGDR